jgi:hypothetical protein
MDALDLTRRPPRSPRLLLADLELLMIARTVDKLRATLPGGNLGSYKIPGFSSRLLDALGISEQALREAIAAAGSEAEVAAWIARNSDPSRYEALNVLMEERKLEDVLDDPTFLERYPDAREYPHDILLFDLILLDDKAMFGEKHD